MATTTSTKTLADYAAIAVAPLLIFLMINSLANYLMLVLYHGGYSERVSWTLFMYTMGVVSVARIAIQRDRGYAMGYLCALAAVTFLAMMRFVGAPFFSLFMLALIAFLSDRIVHDCTLIDESVDASGQGLLDAGGHFVRKQLQVPPRPQASQSSPEGEIPHHKTRVSPHKRGSHPPGRTVLYLALAALPMFGIGQLFLRTDAGAANRAVWLLAVYLFSSFSLLVTTSFLGLRRYLRQRGVDMPNNVSAGWILGGLVVIALVLAIAYLAPLPGQTLASIRLPEFMEPSKDLTASQYGQGNEAAEKKKEDAAVTSQDPNAAAKPTQETTSKEGAPPGPAAEGKSESGPPGKQDGGQKSSSTDPSSDRKKESPTESGKSSESQDGKPQQPPAQSNDSKGESQQPGESKSNETQTDRPQSDSTQSDSTQSAASEPPSEPEPPSARPPSSMPALLNTLGTLLRWIIALALASLVAFYLYLHLDAIRAWLRGLGLGRSTGSENPANETPDRATHHPTKPFAAFRNPIGVEQDPRQIVIVTFQAFEAWTRERGAHRLKDETPSEFLKRIAGTIPQLATPALDVVNAYNRIVYGGEMATPADVSASDRVWKTMKSSAPTKRTRPPQPLSHPSLD
ncbi:hypothetical protein Pla52o_22100 [Novipirellula galeiformis]|uniref:Protein-glutamine gamma-glutamyltransferase-like C-terminal domain-containing protein n=1 Tax=Novipirellula galeiformis TaxID=2528004 RepID=A0A5C6CHA5_9BACT|nr:DUF4129 domain-containing protein [Novipirellula galeiformis]TWU24283.1 hypothetical protein Pla52o_22100 [Novipirellula galeiformis]